MAPVGEPVIAAPAVAPTEQAAPTPVPEPNQHVATVPKTVNGEICRGVVKWFDSYRGYGFIQGADGRDAFVHQTALAGFGALAEGQPVEYVAQRTRKGLQAVSVARPSASARGSR